MGPTPYRVLVSEVMLQQTQAPRVAPSFRAFVRRFPSVAALARAPVAEVVRAWAGLGYNRRAVALWEAARAIRRDHRGRIPRDPSILVSLPGVGPYTAAAVASIGHGEPVPAVDVNVRRVVARARLGLDPSEAPAEQVDHAAEEWLDRRDPAAWNQALMDLGREVCRPEPRCETCPLAASCRMRRRGFPRPRRTARRPGERFEGSRRQVRGRIVEALRHRSSLSLASLADITGLPPPRLRPVVTGLVSDVLVEAGPAALAGRPRGRVRLPR